MSKKSALFAWFARPYVRRRLRKTFSAVRVAGLDALTELLAGGPVILAPNHVAWWDAFLCVALDERLGGGGHCLMDAENLERLPFFGWVGALPLERRNARRALEDLHAASAALTAPGRFLIVFPQGEQRPAHLPLEFQRGVELLAKRTCLPVVPVAVRYDFAQGPNPVVHVSIGAALRWPSEQPFLEELEQRVRAQLSLIDDELLRAPASTSSFRALVVGAEERLPWGASALTRLAGVKRS